MCGDCTAKLLQYIGSGTVIGYSFQMLISTVRYSSGYGSDSVTEREIYAIECYDTWAYWPLLRVYRVTSCDIEGRWLKTT